jgi:hypothetical protein
VALARKIATEAKRRCQFSFMPAGRHRVGDEQAASASPHTPVIK